MITFVLFLAVVLLSALLVRAVRRAARWRSLFRQSRRRNAHLVGDLATTLAALDDSRAMYSDAVRARDAAVTERERRDVQAQSEAFAAATVPRAQHAVVHPAVAFHVVSREVYSSGTSFGLVVGAGARRRDAFAVRWGVA